MKAATHEELGVRGERPIYFFRAPLLTWVLGLVVSLITQVAGLIFLGVPFLEKIKKTMVSDGPNAAEDFREVIQQTFHQPGVLAYGLFSFVGLICFCVGSLWFTISLIVYLCRRTPR